MLKKRIIPCLDVKDGRVVKGINFVDLIDAGDPVEQASIYNQNGADEICFLDITASSDKRDILLDTVKKYHIKGDYAFHNEKSDSSIVKGNSMLEQYFDDDTLQIEANTFISIFDSLNHQFLLHLRI